MLCSFSVRRPCLERNILLLIHGGAASGVSVKTTFKEKHFASCLWQGQLLGCPFLRTTRVVAAMEEGDMVELQPMKGFRWEQQSWR
ncbi:hypothetical protein QYF36_012060 [Acer negundo]|nr:hypothetical protein QYF36_012060 [Acer negundo]